MSNESTDSDRSPALSGARLPPDQRREQLLDIAITLFGDPATEDVSLEDVAKAAGISRNLVYHYFPGKEALIAAAAQFESERLARLTAQDFSLTPAQRIMNGLNAYFDFAESNPHGYRLVYRHASRSTATRAQLDANLENYAKQILGWVDSPTPATKLAVRSWLAYTIFTCLHWLDHPDVTRDELANLCGQMLASALDATGQSPFL